MSTAHARLAERRYLRRVLRSLTAAGDSGVLLLVGSAARRTRIEPSSDLDLVVLGDADLPPAPVGIQIRQTTTSEFEDRARAGDDFSQWALRFGIPLHGRREWGELVRRLGDGLPWPDQRVNVARAEARIADAGALLEMGDLDAAQEQVYFAISQVARARLLEAGVFPRSRPELAGQVGQLGDSQLAEALRIESWANPLPQSQVEELIGMVDERIARAKAPTGRARSTSP